MSRKLQLSISSLHRSECGLMPLDGLGVVYLAEAEGFFELSMFDVSDETRRVGLPSSRGSTGPGRRAALVRRTRRHGLSRRRFQERAPPRLRGVGGLFAAACPGFVDTGTFVFEESTMSKSRRAYAPEFRRQLVELVMVARLTSWHASSNRRRSRSGTGWRKVNATGAAAMAA